MASVWLVTECSALRRVVVVGASLAGLRACETLRTEGYTGPVTLIGAEAHLPYDRPPLSKKLLAGEWEPDRIALRKPDALAELGLDLRLGVPAAAPRHRGPGRRAGRRHDGAVRRASCIATGSRPRRLPGQEAVPTVHELRTLDDSLALRERIADGTARVVVDRRRVHRPRGRRDGPRPRAARSPCSRACRRRSSAASAPSMGAPRPPSTSTTASTCAAA